MAIQVVQVDHGMGGPFDATSKVIATYDDDKWRQALTDLKARGYYCDWNGKPIDVTEMPRYRMFYHHEQAKRWTMGCISYELRGFPEPIPHNKLPESV